MSCSPHLSINRQLSNLLTLMIGHVIGFLISLQRLKDLVLRQISLLKTEYIKAVAAEHLLSADNCQGGVRLLLLGQFLRVELGGHDSHDPGVDGLVVHPRVLRLTLSPHLTPDRDDSSPTENMTGKPYLGLGTRFKKPSLVTSNWRKLPITMNSLYIFHWWWYSKDSVLSTPSSNPSQPIHAS